MKKIKEAKKDNKNITKKGIIIKVAVVAFVIYMCVVMINQQVQIKEKKIQLAALNSQIDVQEIQNKQLNQVLSSDEEQTKEYIEKIAREELGLAKPGEKVYIGVSGS